MTEAVRGPVRVRFAPSPTGYLHVGGARTAIYNELLRRKVGGALILRIEDTDRERSDEAMTRQIQSALAWLGLEFDEGPFLQSERLGRHRERAAELVAADRAYRCFCTPETLEAQRKQAEARGVAFRYPRTCAHLAASEVERRVASGEKFAVRLRMPESEIVFEDLVHGRMAFPPEALDDYILLRSDGTPTYHLSVVVDDVDMTVSHVLRGEDHLSNTPKHVALFRAFGAGVPTFGHMPLILGRDKKRLSKRTGATSVEEFRAQGVLPIALYNYLALLGWSPGEDREILTRAEMIAAFSTAGLNKAAAVFDPDKLLWVNAQHISRLPASELLPHAIPFLAEAGLPSVSALDRERLAAAIELHKSRAYTLRDLALAVVPYFRDEVDYDPLLAGKFRDDPELADRIDELGRRFVALKSFDREALEAALRELAEERGIKGGVLIHPARMALSGAKVGPPLFDLVALMGRDATARHLAHFTAWLRASAV